MIRVAIAGLGNCASALIQGIEFYRDKEKVGVIPGVMHTFFGDYHIKDIEIVAAFDVNKDKIGKDVNEAIWISPNNCTKFTEVPETGVTVQAAPILDGLAPHMHKSFRVDNTLQTVHVADVLGDTKSDMLINYLPVGSRKATEYYAEYNLAVEVARDDYEIDEENNLITLTDRYVIDSFSSAISTASLRNLFKIDYSYVVELTQNPRELEPYFTPLLKDYALAILTRSQL